MKGTGMFVTEEERQQVETAQKVSGMYLSGGIPMGDPIAEVNRLQKKYNPPEGAGLNIKSGEWVIP